MKQKRLRLAEDEVQIYIFNHDALYPLINSTYMQYIGKYTVYLNLNLAFPLSYVVLFFDV